MLSQEIIDKVSERLVERMNNANLFVIKKIARKIKELGKIIPSSANDIIQVMDYGGDLESIAKELAKETSLNVKDIYEIFDEVAKADQRFGKKYYDYKKRKFIPWEENEGLRNQIKAIADQTVEKFVNLSNTRGIGYTIKEMVLDKKTGTYQEQEVFRTIDEVYKRVVDEGILSISQGKTVLDEEMTKMIKQIGRSGLKSVLYESGYTRRVDSAIRMNISDGVREVHNRMRDIMAKDYGADGVEISVHQYPAPDHELVQGKQFTREEFDKFQNDMDSYSYDGVFFPRISEETNQDRRAISQYNCYHYTFPIVIGVDEPTYSEEQLNQIREDNEKGFDYNDKHYTLYEGTQLQRKMETEIRRNKDIQIMALESGKMDLAEESQRRINQLTQEYYELSKQSGLPTRLQRIKVEGYKPIKIVDKENERKQKVVVSSDELPTVKISKEENERLAKIWLDYYEEQGERLRPFEAQRNNVLLGGKINGYKDEKIKLDSIENCQKLLDKVNGQLDMDKGDIKQIDIRLLAQASEGMYEVIRKSPALLNDAKMNKIWLRGNKIRLVGETFMNLITLNTDYFNDYEKFKKVCIESEELHDYLDGMKHSWWTPTAKGNETKQTIYHELGHMLQRESYIHTTNVGSKGYEYWLNKYGEISEYSGEKILHYENSKKVKRDLIYEPIRRLAEKEGLTQKEIINKYVSMYGRSDYEEMFAEMFANSQLGDSNALGDELIEFLKEIGEWEDE